VCHEYRKSANVILGMARSPLEAPGKLLDPCPQFAELAKELDLGIAAGLALRTRDEPARDRRRNDREQREPAEQAGFGVPSRRGRVARSRCRLIRSRAWASSPS
jgi:hypothetical protein